MCVKRPGAPGQLPLRADPHLGPPHQHPEDTQQEVTSLCHEPSLAEVCRANLLGSVWVPDSSLVLGLGVRTLLASQSTSTSQRCDHRD